MKVTTRLTVTGFVCVAMTLAIASAPVPAFAQTKQNVTVVNPVTNPVNVRGTVTVGNSVLPVEISNADPILTRSVDDYGRESFRYHTEVIMGTDDLTEFQKLLATVPAGKRLVIENISWRSQSDTGSQVARGSLGAAQFTPIRAYLQINPPHPLYLDQLQGQDGVQSGPVYFDSEEAVWLRVSKNNFGLVIFNVAINGHFVNL